MNSILVSINKILLGNAIIYVLSVVAFVLQWWGRVVKTETTYGALHVARCTNESVATPQHFQYL